MNSPYHPRRPSSAVDVGGIVVGGGAPVAVQAMTDTDTADAAATAEQCAALAQAGAEMIRITVNTPAAAKKVSEIRSRLDDNGITAPLVGDFHYNGHKLLGEYPSCAAALAKYRINPGNVGRGEKRDPQFAAIINIANAREKPVRIGVNWGSLDQELLVRYMDENARKKTPLAAAEVLQNALVESVLSSARAAENLGTPRNRIIVSCKTSRIPDLLAAYRRLAAACEYPLHLGLTEAGMGIRGAAATSAALAILLAEGIGDTIRASLTPRPGGDRADEVRLCADLLQAMGLRAFSPQVAACPGCGRTSGDAFRRLAAEVEAHIAARLPQWKQRYAGVENLNIAVMGCAVNGPGESRHADVGISLPGGGENPVAPVFADGKKIAALKGDSIASDFAAILENYVAARFGESRPQK
ncbi:MAG: flavodoxin-dependent (E)-4-hydroxy-3-methylbut-2-enyl-diphosphate synthase [Gammaproteobacteria bacterium]